MKHFLWNLFGLRRKRASLFGGEQEARISLPELEEALRSVEPAARLAPPRLLRRVVRLHASLPGYWFRVPHAKSYVIAKEALVEFADLSEVGFQTGDDVPRNIILLERPRGEYLEDESREEVLLRYWDLLFHARVHQEFQRLRAAGRFGAKELARRLAGLGPRLLEEIRQVLLQERFLLPPQDDASVYEEFAAVYLGIRYFRPYLMTSFFPAIESLEEVDAVIAADIDAGKLLEATRLPGTTDPEELREAARAAAEEFDADPLAMIADYADDPQGGQSGIRRTRGRRRSEKGYRLWSRRAETQAARGNLAGAAIRRARAEFRAPRERAAEAAAALRGDVHAFVDRLQAALGIAGDDPRPWREALLALAHQAPRGLWTVEARLLYDLQKVCVDQNREISTVDVMRWVFSRGRQPICRPLPNQRLVLVTRHLHTARQRLPSVRISDRQRRQLRKVLSAATATAEAQLRDSLRPKIVAALDDVGFAPQNLVETVSRKKMIEELLDRIVDRGFLTLGEVRDAISRNHLKEPDCTSRESLLRGDAALRANRRLIQALDGVYEPADFYLRWILRFSQWMFGTAMGRFLTLHLLIPFGGAYVALKAFDHVGELIAHKEFGLTPSESQWGEFGSALLAGRIPPGLAPTLWSGVFLELLVHVGWFRRGVWEGLKRTWRLLRFLLVDSVRWFITLPWVARILHSRMVRLAMNYAVKPAMLTLVVGIFLPAEAARWQKAIGLASLYLGLVLVMNSRLGRTAEEMVMDTAGEAWHRFGVRPMINLFWFIVDLFRTFMQWIERLLYTVDEWLRFKSGQSRTTLVVKAALGMGWFFAAYFIRFCVNLLIEPQINPVKHFPWVTVSHKVITPLWFATGLDGFLTERMGATLGHSLFVVITMGTPGIFGFLIWELKENWRLFAANRSRRLEPALVGSHGESLPGLLRPGIHSGTIPKRFARLRRAERKALAANGDLRPVRKHRERLHHVEVDLHRYIEREFIAWFVECRRWTAPAPKVGEIHLATRLARVELRMPGTTEPPLLLEFRLIDGRVRLELDGKVLGENLPEAARQVFAAAMINVLKTGAIEVYCRGGQEALDGPPPKRHEIARVEMPWPEWVTIWENDGALPSESAWKRIELV